MALRKQAIPVKMLGDPHTFVKGKPTVKTNRQPLGELSNKIKINRKPKELLKPTTEPKVNVTTVRSTNTLKQKPVAVSKTTKKPTPVNTVVVPTNVHKFKLSPLPQGVESIDNVLEESEQLVPQYARYIYNYLLHIETMFPIKPQFLHGQEVNEKMRSILVDWIFEVSQHFKLMQETYQLTVAIVDRYMQEVKSTTKEKLQLVGVSSLFIGAKYEELDPLEVHDLVFICDGACSIEEIFKMEVKILQTLKFKLGRPVSITFARRYSKISKANPLQHSYCKYFIDLALTNYDLSHIRPSLLAATATYIAMCLVNEKINPDFWTETLTFYSEYKFVEIQPIVADLARTIVEAANSKHQAIRLRYSSSDLQAVSLRPSLLPENGFINQLC